MLRENKMLSPINNQPVSFVDHHMTVFVLTQLEGKAPTPVATVSSERSAKEWFRKTVGNDFYPLVLDSVDHLGLVNGPAFVKPLEPISIPTPPLLRPDMEPVEALEALKDYMTALCASVEKIDKALNG